MFQIILLKITSYCDGSVNSYLEKFHVRNQFLAFHLITVHFRSKLRISVHAFFPSSYRFDIKFTQKFASFSLKISKNREIVILGFRVSRKL